MDRWMEAKNNHDLRLAIPELGQVQHWCTPQSPNAAPLVAWSGTTLTVEEDINGLLHTHTTSLLSTYFNLGPWHLDSLVENVLQPIKSSQLKSRPIHPSLVFWPPQ